MKRISATLIFILVISFSACIDIEELSGNKTVLLTEKVWAFDNVTGYDDFGTQLASALLNGMTYKFDKTGSYSTVVLGAPGEGIWEFNIDETGVILEPGTVDAIDWQIEALDDTQLIVSFAEADALSGRATWYFK